MNNASRLMCLALATSAVTFAASAAVTFSDDFEGNAVGTVLNSPPPIGQAWNETTNNPQPGSGFGANLVTVVSNPAIGSRAIKIIRPNSAEEPLLKAVSLPGTIVDGNIVEVKWSHNYEGAHAFNNPMQMDIGHSNSTFNNHSAFILQLDTGPGGGNIGYYTGPGQYSALVDTGVDTSINTEGANEGRWDDFRAVLTYSQLNATQMSGTMDLFVKINGGAEQQLANDALLSTSTIPGSDPTSMQLLFGKGAFTFNNYYDNISIEVIGVVPEPASIASLAGLAVIGLRRRKN